MSSTPDSGPATQPEAPNPAAAAAPGTGKNADKLDRRVLAIASVVVIGAIMSILDVTVVSVAIPTLQRDFGVELTTIQWIATGYTLALATVIPLTAWAGDRFGTKRLYMISIVLFVAGSVLAGFAWDITSLIVFRVLQGLGGGMLMPVGMTIMTRAAGPDRVGRVMAIIGIPMLLGPICGPILGGWLVDSFSWRWIFFINLPIGIIGFILAARILPRDGSAIRGKLDVLGLALLSPGLALLIYGFAEYGALHGLGHAQVIVPLIVGAVLFAGFIWHALRVPDPLIDLRLFANKVFSASIATMVLMILAVFGGMLLLPIYLQMVRGETALDTGLLLAPQGIGAMLVMPIAGQLADRTGVGRIVPVGLAIIAGSFWYLTGLEADTSYWHLGIALFAMGVGMGFTMMPTFTGALQTLRRRSIANASTTLNITQQVGASIGTALMTVILYVITTNKFTDAFGPAAGATSDPAALAALPPEVKAQIATIQANSFGQTFWWAFAFVCVSFVVALVLLPKRKPAPVEDDEAGTGAPVMMH
ncbi:multidrug resistance protein B [Pseudonocardia sulfidoxydans NBRC 16205]|uniref:Multidrug resistance protein B n=1 Tax=Pseudonocardia sulfidoxydans NBRC 16205 TaxID=1223511 RepID=A0A511DA14_9PSEU|nr:DHA2 family efflux MFS transporter permease subunit [Pseudonocardia sulfidoxydans]GEL21655.1 multidrug resistance protein B [Pseudonocardia sulfidoxydans NBRC 16205]